ncbi:serine hydrolase domain-containing protein [Paenibacillus lemnae]|uniref:Serine hydrolase n=1 Tax=Paenibacillus lemnae TaxID=1330551 RepID=A0A848MC62_PAELE|nr:serine hydrolase [Paenibacillus lemnae]NMO97632.1 serine hydrolase [Paenibacillus lemnae]
MEILWNDKNQNLADVFKKEKIHSCLISRGSHIIFEYYKNKKQHSNLHKINSCTKSIASSLIGIACDKGFISNLSTPIVEYFPTLANDSDRRKSTITIDHLLTMSAGFNWPEMGEWGGWPQMIHSSNWVNYVLERPLTHAPGEQMNYNSGCSHLLMAILQKTTGTSAQEFANDHLFSKLKFRDYIWHKDPQGIHIGGFGIHLTIHDMHKMGQLFLNNGRWAGKQLIRGEWVELTTKPAFLTYEYFGHYGRHWWSSAASKDEKFYFAMGMGGQYICVMPSRDMIVTITSDTKGNTLTPLHVIKCILNDDASACYK